MAMETDPTKINNPDRALEARLFKEGQNYAEDNAESKERNKSRAESRERIKEAGVNPQAFGTAIRLIKTLSPRELTAWREDFNLVLKVMGSKQAELFPEEAIRASKREADRKAKEKADAKAAKEAARKTGDDNPRSDPKSGGAGKAPKKAAKKTAAKKSNVVKLRPTEAELTAAAANAAAEQDEGGEVLSQSAQSKQKLSDAGMN